jgi:Domain of unknown function (4846)
MYRVSVCFLLGLVLSACGAHGQPGGPAPGMINAKGGGDVKSRFNTPAGYTRVNEAAGSFAAYLRGLKLKPSGSVVHYYNGSVKENHGVYVAVVDLPIGNKDLHQCADAIMHVRAKYFYDKGEEDKIHFTFTNGMRVDYSKWKQGYRMTVKGNKTSWVKTAQPGHSYAGWWQYMELIFNYCGTLSLSHELISKPYKDLQPGDVLIKGGSPGHAVLVLDVAQNKEGQKVYLLAQSYMPAQELQVLANPTDAALSPWYELKPGDAQVVTPEWVFTTGQLMRFGE